MLQELVRCAEPRGEEASLLVAVGKADRTVRKRIEHVLGGDLLGALVRHNERDVLTAAFVEDRRNFFIARDDGLTFIDIEIDRRLVVAAPAGALLRRRESLGDK